MKTKRLMMCLLLSMALAVTLIPGVSFAAPEGGDGQETVTVEAAEETVQPDVDLAESDELLQTYMEKHAKELLVGKKKSGKLKAPRADRLESEADTYVYNVLKDHLRAIADGEADSTIIKIPMSDIFDDLSEKTDEDLGVTIVENGAITAESVEALQECYPINFDQIVNALLTDLPYELYWYDKTSGCTHSYPEIGASGYGDNWSIYFKGEAGDEDNPCITFKFAVSNDYMPSGESDGFTVDTEVTSPAAAAAASAVDVVTQYADVSDYEKLKGYKETICEYTDYNHPAAENDDTAYGDPWQLIWVFDNDPDTKVVCEGYSKAFQYLCDLSTFDDSIVESHIVTGEMFGDEGATGAGNHMWNIVQMDDELNYLVDVTNSDKNDQEQSIGYPEYLFLKGFQTYTEENAYVFDCNGSTISYVYDSETLALYDEAELALSDQNYDPEAAQDSRNQRAINHVIELIDAIAEFGEITADNYEEVAEAASAAREAYDALDESLQAEVTNYIQLQQAESEVDAISEEMAAVNDVIDLINALSDITTAEDITDEVKAQIEEARAAYNNLTLDQQNRIDEETYAILENAESLAEQTLVRTIEVGKAEQVNIEKEGDEVIFRFTPESDGAYIFTSTGDESTYGSLYDADNNWIAGDRWGGEKDNFRLAFRAKAGETYFLHCSMSYRDETGSFEVILTDSPVQSISYTFGKQNKLMENVRGDIENEGTDNEFFRYYDPSPERGDILTVTDKEGKQTLYTYTYSERVDETGFVSEGDKLYIAGQDISFTSDQYENHWTVGSENAVIISYLGAETTAKITIEENPVTGIKFAHKGKAEMFLVKDRDGSDEYDYGAEKEYYKYQPRFNEGDTLTLEGSGGPCGTYTWLDSKDGFYLKGKPVISEYGYDLGVDIQSNQSADHPWTDLNGDYKFMFSCYGQSCDIAVKLVNNPITKIEYAGDPVSLTERVEARWADPEEPDGQGHYEYELGSVLKDGSSKLILSGTEEVAGTYVYDEDAYAFVCEELGKIVSPEDICFVGDEQDETPWVIGNTQNSTWSYQGIEFQVPVTLIENQVKSITFEPADAEYYIFEQKDQKVFMDKVYDEFRETLGHKLTVTKKDGTQVEYTYQEVDDEDLEYSRYFVSADGNDMISEDDLIFTTGDETWTAGSNANVKVSYMGVEDDFTMPVRKAITGIKYEPAKVRVVYEGAGGYDGDEYYYNIDGAQEGDVLKLFDSDEEGAEPAFVFTCKKDIYGGFHWQSDGLDISRIGHIYIDDNQPWEGAPGAAGTMEATLYVSHNYDDDDEFYTFSDEIPVTLSQEVPVKSVTYQQVSADPVELYEGIDDTYDAVAGGVRYNGYSVIKEGDTVTVVDSDDNTKVYTATYDEDEDGLFFLNEGKALDLTFMDIQPKDPEDGWTAGLHDFIFSYYGVESTKTMKVNILQNPISDVVFDPSENGPIVWDAEETERDGEDAEGNPIIIYRPYYEDVSPSVFRDGDKLTFKWKGTEKTYTYRAEDSYYGNFVDEQGKYIQAPVNYVDDQEKGDVWKIGDNNAYVTVGGVRSEAFTITVKCKHRVVNHTDGIEATCTKAGQAEYWTCAVCGNMYKDAECKIKIDEPIVLPASHRWGDWTYVNEDLHKHECSECHETESAVHNWDAGTVTKEATEDEPGQKICTCSDCGGTKTVEIPPLKHEHEMVHTEATQASCTKEGNKEYWQCSKCEKYFEDEAGTKEYAENAWVIPKKAHTMTATEAVDPTCTAAGNSAYWYCSECKQYFSDAEGKNVIDKDSWIIAATGHGDMKEHAAKEATCTEAGNTAYWYCSKCDKYFSDKNGENEIQEDSWILDKTGHTMTATPAKEPTCTEAGNDAYWHCSECGKYFGDAEGKTVIEEDSWILPASHNLKDHPAKAPTCTATGNSAYWQCSECGKYFSDAEGKNEIEEDSWIINKVSHKLTAVAAKEPTCTETGNSAYWQCSECGKYFSDEDGENEIQEDSWILEKTRHTMTAIPAKDSTCTEAGNSAYWKCSECGKYFSDAEGKNEIEEDSWIINKVSHKLTAVAVKEPTCTETGNSAYWQCSECNKYYSDEKGKNEIEKDSWILAATGHAEMDHQVAVDATYTKAGNLEYWYCSKCDKYYKDADGTDVYGDDEWYIEAKGGKDVAEAATTADTKLAEAKGIAPAGYSAKSYAAVTEAIEALENLLKSESPGATADEIKTATQNLQSAIDNLKMTQTLNVKAKKTKVKVKKVKKKKQTVTVVTVSGAKTTLKYSGKPVGKKAKKALKINAKTGKITVTKKTKKGKYKMKVTVTAVGNAKYEAASKTVTVTVQVK